MILLNQNLTRWKNLLSKTEDFRKCWLEDSLVMKSLVQKLFDIPVFFSDSFYWKKTQNCQFWRFFRFKKLQKVVFRKQSFLQNVICKKIVFEILCVVKLSIQNLKLFLKFISNLTRTKFLDSKSDILSKILIENVFRIHFLWQPSFLRKHRKSIFDVFTMHIHIFLENEFRNRIWFFENNSTWTRDALWYCWIRTWHDEQISFQKLTISQLFPRPGHFFRFIFFKEALNCHLWNFYRVLSPKFFRKRGLQQNLIL